MVGQIVKFVCSLLCLPAGTPNRGLRILGVLICFGILGLALAPIAVTAITSFAGLFSHEHEAEMSLPPEAEKPFTPAGGWPQRGITGTYNRAALQRGYQVYAQVCSTCHSLKLLSYRDLTQLGFSPAEVKAIASNFQVADINDNGEPVQRKALSSDHFVSPFPNDKAARAANGGALPPDLSLIVKARAGHEDYIYSILTGFGKTTPSSMAMGKGMNYNPYFPGHQIAMPAPLHEGAVSFADGTPATVEQMAKDVTQFLAWASEPHLEARHQTGIKVVLFLLVFAGLMYAVKRKVWKKLH